MSNDGSVSAPEFPPPSTDMSIDDVEAADARRTTIMTVAGVVLAVLIAGLSILPAPYAIGAPGPTFDTLGELRSVPAVRVTGAPTYDTSGELRLTTVSVSDASGSILTLGRVMKAWVADSEYVVPVEEVFGRADQEDAFEQMSQQAWVTSQESATVSALEALGTDVPATLTVAAVDEESNAWGLLEQGDRLVALDGLPLTTFSALSRALEDTPAGAEISVTVDRGGLERQVSFDTLAADDGGSLMGIFVDPQFDPPISVSVAIDDVGGPSAGLMFTLAIMDVLTPEDELGGARVAGTGAVTADGEVQPIGGIRMKLHGAVDDGAQYFLAPEANCDEVVGNVPDGLQVVAVNTVDEAYEAITSIGRGESDGLPTCDTDMTP